MTALVIRILTCDGVDDGEVCDAEYGGDPAVPSLYDLRIEARNTSGWRQVASSNSDFCPQHPRRDTP